MALVTSAPTRHLRPAPPSPVQQLLDRLPQKPLTLDEAVPVLFTRHLVRAHDSEQHFLVDEAVFF